MEFKDYYTTLGVAKSATAKEIKQAYRKLARKFHPDVNPGDKQSEARFKEINEAYEVLGDSDKRKKYDELGANWRMYEQAGPQTGGPFGGAYWSTGGGPGGFRTMSEEEMHRVFGDEDPFSDFFKTFFGGVEMGNAGRPGAGRAPRPRQGHDVEHEVDLSIEDAFRGTTARLSLKHDGQSRTLDVRIPPGVTSGSRVRVPNEGEHGTGGAPAGDLYLRVRLRPDSRFEIKGHDLYARVPLPVTTAVLGGEVDVPTPAGRPLRLKIPPTTQNGQVFRLKGHGMPPIGKAGVTGDLYATVDVRLPQHVTDQQRQHYEALARLESADVAS
jgi:DnaJ-class molecular chaperone